MFLVWFDLFVFLFCLLSFIYFDFVLFLVSSRNVLAGLLF